MILARNFVFHDLVTPTNIARDTEPIDGKNPITPASRSSPNVGFHPRYERTISRPVIAKIKTNARVVDNVKSLGLFIIIIYCRQK